MSRDEPWERVAFFDGALAYDMLPQRLKDAASGSVSHHTTIPSPVMKMDSHKPIGYRWKCTCGREGRGMHPTEEAALKYSKDHVRGSSPQS